MIQLQFINYLISTGDKTSLTINGIDNSFFSEYYEEFKFIKEHIDSYGNVPDSLSFAAKFPRFDFIEVNETPEYLVDELYKDKNKRALAKTFNEVRTFINEGNVDAAMSVYLKAAESVTSATHMSATNILTDTSRYEAYAERTQDFFKYYVKTGFKEVDDAIGGWDKSEELATLVARPGVGKSWILFKCATAAVEQGLRVGLYSGEMSANKVGYRVDTLIGHISNRGITQGKIDVQNDYKMYIDSLKDKFNGELWVITPKDLGRQATVTDLRAFIEKYNLDMLCIDQHSLMEDERRGRDAVTRAANISKDLKNLQVLKKIPIIAVSQQNRSIVDETAVIDVSHIAQADRIGQDSTVVIFIEQKDGVMTLHLAKARDATSGSKIKYAIDLDKGVFSYIPAEEDALNGSGCDALRREYESPGYGEEAF